jgi:hypothetical protein
MRSCRRQGERGMTLILVALCIVVFIGIAALAVDVGVLYTARTSAQHAADAGALAGAFTFVDNPLAAQPATAVDAAVRIANQNNVMGTAAGVTAGDVTVDLPNRRVTVLAPRNASRGNAIALYFARIFGLTTSDIAASATAEASSTPTGGRCIKPIYIPNTALSPAVDAPTACNASPPQIMFDPATGQLSAWMQSQPNQGFGANITLKPNSPPGALVPSQYYTLDLGAGANTYACVWASCMSDPACGASQTIVQCGTQYPVKTGNMVGPTKQGMDNLICGPSGNCNTDPADTWGGVGVYYPPGGGPASSTSRSLQVAPVWDDCAQVINPGTNGQQAKVIGFVEIFVDGITGNNVVGHVVNPQGCSGNPGGGTGPFATPIRLVQAPPAS